MADLVMRTAIGDYGHTKGLKDGTATSDKFDMEHIDVSPVTSIFRRMVRGLEFDVCEMALSTYLCARAHGKAFTGIPIFLTRSFYHGGITYNQKSGIKSPEDLAGRKIGVRGYTVTPGVWTRGLLQTVYGLDLNSVTWVLSGDEHVAEFVAPSNVVSSPNGDLNAMLLSGEIDAAIGAGISDSPDIKHLFSDPDGADADLVRQHWSLPDKPYAGGQERPSGEQAMAGRGTVLTVPSRQETLPGDPPLFRRQEPCRPSTAQDG